jgi:DNA (cytosine-5)-methyltransferase 1
VTRSTNPVAWYLSDLAGIPKNGVKFMSTFACGGGSSMGYKLAGCEVVAANDIDPEMAWHYKANINPRHYFLCPIRDLLTADLPEELFALDILDGSPPCSTFSMAGNREKDWGKAKHFREGQAEQVLSDLFFDYLDLVARLRPKVAVAENVKGMLIGNANGYTKMVCRRFEEIGYRVQVFLLNAADCGVPQRRERVFFVALRNDIALPKLVLDPRERWISAGEACADIQVLTDEEREDTKPAPNDLKCWPHTKKGDSYATFLQKTEGRHSCFNNYRIDDSRPSNTLASNEGRKYIIGMSVPPLMAEFVARAVCSQWLGVEDGGRRNRGNLPGSGR